MKYVVNLKQLEQLAENYAKKVKRGNVYLLHGDLGSGKTTFTKMVFHYLGVKEKVTSPTFVIMKSYQAGELKLYHLDGYRLDHSEDFGFQELIENGAVFIEWPDKFDCFWQQAEILKFTYIDENTREVEII